MDDKVFEHINELIDKRGTGEILLNSITELKLSKKSVWQYVISLVFGGILAYAVGFSDRTIEISVEILGILFNTSVAICGMILGAYAVFQALLQNELILILLKSKNNILKESNNTFLNIVVLNVGNIIISFFAKCVLQVMDKQFLLLEDITWNNIISAFLLFFYFSFNFLLLFEIMIFSLNLYRMFCAHNAVKALDAIEEDDEID